MTTEYSDAHNNKKISLRDYFLFGGLNFFMQHLNHTHARVESSSFGHSGIIARTEVALDVKYHPSFSIINNLLLDLNWSIHNTIFNRPRR